MVQWSSPLKYPRTPPRHFFSGVVLRWCRSVCFLRQKALPCSAAVGFPFLLRARRCRSVTLTKACASPQVFVAKPSQMCNWLCQLWTSVLRALKSQAALELWSCHCRLKFWVLGSLWGAKRVVFLWVRGSLNGRFLFNYYFFFNEKS